MSGTPKKRIEMSLIVAVIGLCAALISSPLVFKWVEGVTVTPGPSTPTTASNLVVVFTEDFEDDSVDGFSVQAGQWATGHDKSNKVLEVKSDPSSASIASFGPAAFADGSIDFRIQFVSSGGFSFRLRDSAGSAYVLRFEPQSLGLDYVGPDGGLSPLGANGSSPYNFLTKQWYAIHLEARAAQLTATVDGDRLRISASDPRLGQGGLAFSVDPGVYVLLDDIRVSAYGP
jgi:hypothetical protein